VIVVFIVSEQRQVTSVLFRGNSAIGDIDLQSVVSVRSGEAIDRFRIPLAKSTIEQMFATRIIHSHMLIWITRSLHKAR